MPTVVHQYYQVSRTSLTSCGFGEIIESRERGGLVTEQIEAAIRTYREVTEVGAGFGQCLVGKPDCESNEPMAASSD
jgi:hypothetical protein